MERYEVFIDRKRPPVCCRHLMEKLVSTGCFDLRGSGFYENEYGKGAHKLETTQQAQRASVDCGNKGIVASRAKPIGPHALPEA